MFEFQLCYREAIVLEQCPNYVSGTARAGSASWSRQLHKIGYIFQNLADTFINFEQSLVRDLAQGANCGNLVIVATFWSLALHIYKHILKWNAFVENANTKKDNFDFYFIDDR